MVSGSPWVHTHNGLRLAPSGMFTVRQRHGHMWHMFWQTVGYKSYLFCLSLFRV